MGAPVGNKNAAKSKAFYGALNRAIAQDDGERLRKSAERLLDLAAEGEQWAVLALRDTLDGKPAQAIDVAGPGEDGAIVHEIRRTVVKAA